VFELSPPRSLSDVVRVPTDTLLARLWQTSPFSRGFGFPFFISSWSPCLKSVTFFFLTRGFQCIRGVLAVGPPLEIVSRLSLPFARFFRRGPLSDLPAALCGDDVFTRLSCNLVLHTLADHLYHLFIILLCDLCLWLVFTHEWPPSVQS